MARDTCALIKRVASGWPCRPARTASISARTIPRKSETRFRPVVSTDLPLIVGGLGGVGWGGEGGFGKGVDRSRGRGVCVESERGKGGLTIKY